MREKRILNIAGIVVIILVAVLGGKIYLDKQEAKKQTDLIEAERMSVIALKNTFQDIKSVEFLYSHYEPIPDGYTFVVRVLNKEGKAAEFDYDFFKGRDKITSFEVVDKTGVQTKGETTEKVHVIYSNDEEEEM